MENRKRNQLYTDKEIGKLIKRATEFQKESEESQKRGLSLKKIDISGPMETDDGPQKQTQQTIRVRN